MSNELYERDTFVNENIPYIFNVNIYEYDMKEAGFSLIQEFKLLDDKTIQKLFKYDKRERARKIGIMQNNKPNLKENLKVSFKIAREKFFKANNLEENDIISIKKDAIFTTKECKHQKFGDYIYFRPKNNYTSYIQLSKHLEFYYNSEVLDIKGLSDENYELHKDFMINFINKFFIKMESSTEEDTLRFYRNFIDKYKERGLDVGYYRSFDSKSVFNVIDEDTVYMDFWDDEKDRLDISYNYMNILMKLVKILL